MRYAVTLHAASAGHGARRMIHKQRCRRSSGLPWACVLGCLVLAVARHALLACAAETNATHAQALRQLFVDTGGADGAWANTHGWQAAGGDPCDDGWGGVACDADGSVTRVRLDNNQLSGSIDAVVGLTSVKEVYLYSNQLGGGIDAVAGLASLEVLYLNDNQFNGSIDAVAGLANLKQLYLNNNQLSGTIDAVAGLSSLAHLSLYDNDFSGSIDALAGLTRLERAFLYFNHFSGGIDALARLTSLKLLHLGSNELTGSIDAVSGLARLEELYLYGNQFVGGIGAVAGLTRLTQLYLNSNQFTGSIDAVARLTSLTHLYLYINQFSGGLDAVAGLSSLKELEAGTNQLSGSIDAVAGLKSVTMLYLYNNQLSGGIDAVAGLTTLRRMLLNGNQLSGRVDAVAGLTGLTILGLLGNDQLHGHLDVSQLTSLTQLRLAATGISNLVGHTAFPSSLIEFDISDTDISSLPEGAFSLCGDTITTVEMEGAAFPDPCPAGQLARAAPVSGAHYCERNQSLGLRALYDETGGVEWSTAAGWASAALSGLWDPCEGGAVVGQSNWTGVECGGGAEAGRVTRLQLDGNGLVGDAHGSALSSLSSVAYLDLGNNQLSGGLDAVASLANLEYLALSNNQFSGSIEALGPLTGLEHLSLNNNLLSGNLDVVAGLVGLQHLNLDTNELGGRLDALAGLASLQVLSLADNQLSGGIDAVVSLTGLTNLSLASNRLSGSIDAVASLSNLMDVSLADNQFSGGLAAVAGIRGMTRLYLDNNRLSGVIPLAQLVVSDLREFVADQNDLSAVEVQTDEFVVWCASLDICRVDQPQAPAVAAQFVALRSVAWWYNNATAHLLPWSDVEGDPCQLPWPGVVCDWQGRVRHVDVPAMNETALVNNEALGGDFAVPVDALMLGDARELLFIPAAVWPPAALQVTSNQPVVQRATSSVLELGTKGTVVDTAELWLQWHTTNDTEHGPRGKTPTVDATLVDGAATVDLNVSNATSWPHGAAVDATVELHASLASDEPLFTSIPPLPTDRTLLSWRVDTLPPAATLVVAPPRVVASRRVNVTFGCSESGCRYQYSMDGGATWSTATSGDDADDGQSDAAGATPGPAGFSRRTHFMSTPLHITPDSTAVFVLAKSADISGFQFQLDGSSTWQHSDSGEIHVEDLAPGWHTIVVRALQSGTGAPDAEPVAHSWEVQPSHALAPPMALRIKSGPPAVTPLATAAFVLETAHARSLLEYRLDGGPWHATVPSMSVGPVTEGEHLLEVRGTSLERGQDGLLNGYVEAPDAWRWTYQPGNSGLQLEVDNDGEYSIMVRATDPAGNQGTASSPFPFLVDTVAPTTTAAVESVEQATAWWSTSTGGVGPPPFDSTTLPIVLQGRLNVSLGAADGAAHSQPCSSCVAMCTVTGVGNSTTPVSCGDIPLPEIPAGASSVHAVQVGRQLEDGPLQLTFAARDEAGNADVAPMSVVALLDTEPPSMKEAGVVNARRVIDGVSVVSDSAVQLAVNCVDSAGIGCAFSVELAPDLGGTVQHASREGSLPTAADISVLDVPDGEYAVVVMPWDATGHTAEVPATASVRVDTTPPAAAELSVTDEVVLARAEAGLPVNTSSVVLLAVAAGSSGGAPSTDELLLEGFTVCVDAVLATAPAGWSTAPVEPAALSSELCSAPPPSGSYSELPGVFEAPTDALRADGLGLRASLHAADLVSGAWRVSVWAVDAAGNVADAAASVVLSVDTRPPVVSLSVGTPPSGTLISATGTVTLAVNVTEAGCTFRADVDDVVDAVTSTSPAVQIATPLDAPDGQHEVRVWAVDAAGNRALQPLLWRWWLDTTAPGVDARAVFTALRGGVTLSAASASNVSSPTVAARCVEADPSAAAVGATCSMLYTLDEDGGDAAAPFTARAASGETVTLPGLRDGPHVLRIVARDGVGNEDDRNASAVRWITDTQAPVVGGMMVPRHVNVPTIDVPLSCIDRSLCTLYIRVTGRRAADGCTGAVPLQNDAVDDDGDTPAEWIALAPESWTLEASPGATNVALNGSDLLRFSYQAALRGLGDGEQRVEVRATDGAGQESAATQGATFYVDTVAPPTPVIEAGLPALTSDRKFTWRVRVAGEMMAPAGVDATVLQYELTTPTRVTPWQSVDVSGEDGGADASLVRFAHETSEQGQHVLAFRARDAAGNVGTVTTAEWVVATSPPRTGLLAHPPSTSGVDYAHFVFNASLPVGVVATGPVTDALRVEVRLGTGEWEDVPCEAAERSGAAGGDEVRCTHRLTHLELGSYILSARARDAAGNVDPSPQQVSWTVALCGGDEYEVLREGGRLECAPCPEGAWCGDADRPNVTFAAVGAMPGWWTSGARNASAYYQCRIASACLGGDGAGTRSACAQGHESRLCSLCSAGYFMRWDGCRPCPDTKAASWAFLVGVAVALVASAALVFKLRSFLPMAMIKVMATGLQILASASAVYNVPWPEPVARLLDALRVSLLEVMTLLRVSCTSPMTFYTSLALTLLVFKGVALVVVVAVAWSSVRQRRAAAREAAVARGARACNGSGAGALRATAHSGQGDGPHLGASSSWRRSSLAAVTGNIADTARVVRDGLDWWRVFKLMAMYLLLAYPGVSMKLLRTFNCVDIDGSSWLVADMRLPCYDATWGGFALWSAGTLAAYTVGLPVFICAVLWRHRHRLREPEVRDRLGFLYEEHGEHAYFGEPMELLRKLLLSSLPLFFEPGSPMQLLYALIISFGAAVAHAALKPFRQFRRAYYLQHASLAASFSLFAMGLVYKTDGLDRSSAAYDALSYLLLGVQASFVAVGLLLIVHASASRLLQELHRRDVTKLLSTTVTAATPRRRAQRADPGAPRARSPQLASPSAMIDNPMRAAARGPIPARGAGDRGVAPGLEMSAMAQRGP